MSSHKILVVEDSKTQALKLQFLLEQEGFYTVIAKDGVHAIEILEEENFSLIISDVVMPRMDGLELCSYLKSHQDYKHIPIILLTALSRLKDVLAGLSRGADNFISKPYDSNYVLYRISQVLNPEKDQIVIHEDNISLRIQDEDISIKASSAKILNYFISSYEASVIYNRELQEINDELGELANNLESIVKDRTSELEEEIQGHKNTLRQLQEALENSQRLDKMKSEFMNNLSHEIRTPMNAIIGFTDLFTDKDISEMDMMKYLPMISQSVKSLLVIISDIIEASEVLSGYVSIQQTKCQIEQVFEEILWKYNRQGEIDNAKVNVSYYVPEVLTQKVIETYCREIKMILDKLISNALKFTEDGAIIFGVEVLDKALLKFYVKDTGIGIPEHLVAEVFDSFKQVVDPKKTKTHGTGLGLTVAKKLVDMFKGEIWMNSQEGVGSEFYFTVPFRYLNA
jgi:signal transduction histidine kinase